jgi:hypothetical protein
VGFATDEPVDFAGQQCTKTGLQLWVNVRDKKKNLEKFLPLEEASKRGALIKDSYTSASTAGILRHGTTLRIFGERVMGSSSLRRAG